MSKATIRDVARLADVSLGTMSNYLNDTKPIASDTRGRIEAAIAELQFVPNTAVRVLHGHRSHVIAFIVPDGGNPFFREVARGIEDVAVTKGHVVVSCNTDGNPERERIYAKALGEMRVRAAITVASPETNLWLKSLTATGARCVVLGPTGSEAYSSVTVDDRQGGRLAMEHVLEVGCRRPLLFGGPGAAVQIAARLAGHGDALAAAGIDPASLDRVDAVSAASADRSRAARTILERRPRPDAVVCANDLLALALEAEAIQVGVQVPDDLAIVGYDDIETAATAPIPLTTVHQPQYEIGRVAAELAFADTGVPRQVVFEPRLIERWSTRGSATESRLPSHDPSSP